VHANPLGWKTNAPIHLCTCRVQGVWDACKLPGAEDSRAPRGDVGQHALLGGGNPSKKPFSLNCRIMHDSEDEALLTRRVQGVWDACQSPGAEDRCAGRGDVGYHALLVCRAPQQEAHGP